GRTVDFKNTVVIMTSNLGSQAIIGARGSYDTIREEVLAALHQHFRPEFLNRVDDIVVFHAFAPEHVREIVELQLPRLEQRRADRPLRWVFTDAARDYLANRGYDPVYGARPLKRAIAHEVETPMAHLIIAGKIYDGAVVHADVKPGGGLKFDVESEGAAEAT